MRKDLAGGSAQSGNGRGSSRESVIGPPCGQLRSKRNRRRDRMASGWSMSLAATERMLSVREVLPPGSNTLLILRTWLKRLKATWLDMKEQQTYLLAGLTATHTPHSVFCQQGSRQLISTTVVWDKDRGPVSGLALPKASSLPCLP